MNGQDSVHVGCFDIRLITAQFMATIKEWLTRAHVSCGSLPRILCMDQMPHAGGRQADRRKMVVTLSGPHYLNLFPGPEGPLVLLQPTSERKKRKKKKKNNNHHNNKRNQGKSNNIQQQKRMKTPSQVSPPELAAREKWGALSGNSCGGIARSSCDISASMTEDGTDAFSGTVKLHQAH